MEMERLVKVIANSGYTSRRKAEELISSGKVMVNGIVAVTGQKIDGNDIVTIDGKEITMDNGNYEYFLLNKPRGVITSSSDEVGRKTVVDLVKTNKRIYPVGRLDYDTTGALLLTNDGNITNLLTHPKNEIEKKYLAKLEGILDMESLNKLKKGIKIDGILAVPDRVKIRSIDKKKNTCLVEIVLHEGRNHEVKKLFEAVGYSVIRLTRVTFAGLNVKDLKSGEYRKLSIKEVQRLYSLIKK